MYVQDAYQEIGAAIAATAEILSTQENAPQPQGSRQFSRGEREASLTQDQVTVSRKTILYIIAKQVIHALFTVDLARCRPAPGNGILSCGHKGGSGAGG